MTKNTIKIPELCLVLLVGPSGSGKSSFAKKHFRSTEIISSDYCRAVISDDENDQNVTKEAFELLHFIASKRLIGGKLTVIDATNVQPESRKSLIALAKEHNVITVAIILNLSSDICIERNARRPDRQFGKHVVLRQSDQLQHSIKNIKKEGVSQVYVLNSPEEIENISIEKSLLWNNLKAEKGPFDIIGDVHGCFDELLLLLTKLGYQVSKQEDGEYIVTHQDARRLIFVGDLVDRGPKTPEVLRIAMNMVESSIAFCINGNHDEKLKRKLLGKDVKIAHGLAESLKQLELETQEFKDRAIKFLDGLIGHYVFDDGKLAVSHAGIKEEYIGRGSPRVRAFCMFGETTGEIDEFGLPARYQWARDYRGSTMIVYGHTPIPEVEWINNTINIDTGCVFGGKLTALRYPEKEIVSVDAKQVYADPIKPIGFAPEDKSHKEILDISDVSGKRILETSLNNNITISEENATAALEVISRFSVHPGWLIYLPPTMSPTETSAEYGLLEHPNEAFAFYRNRRVDKVICQEKHMGSRAIMIICKNNDVARKRFRINGAEIGICYTRTGRAFFNDTEIEKEFLARISGAITKAGLWEEFNTDWFCFDSEIMPWSAKASSLLQGKYAAVGAAAMASLPESITLLKKVEKHVEGAAALLRKFQSRLEMLVNFQEAYRHYCWPVENISDYKIAPFHILASEGSLNMDKDHQWHMDVIYRLCEIDPELFKKTVYKIVDTNDELSCKEASSWWSEMTANGSEGIVVKPMNFTQKGNKGLIQPGIKCRGVEYLRLIYGPEYTEPSYLEKLRARELGVKRSLALREFALGYESLKRFVQNEPLYRVHEMVFGVLALESEPVDPRL
ncbi:MAG: polynucleotide kinase-phosphatase [Rickettsiaceae bacterium]|nr:polynucleotide kinase-phosphatase [Rickettsiaceae bacterium]